MFAKDRVLRRAKCRAYGEISSLLVIKTWRGLFLVELGLDLDSALFAAEVELQLLFSVEVEFDLELRRISKSGLDRT